MNYCLKSYSKIVFGKSAQESLGVGEYYNRLPKMQNPRKCLSFKGFSFWVADRTDAGQS